VSDGGPCAMPGSLGNHRLGVPDWAGRAACRCGLVRRFPPGTDGLPAEPGRSTGAPAGLQPHPNRRRPQPSGGRAPLVLVGPEGLDPAAEGVEAVPPGPPAADVTAGVAFSPDAARHGEPVLIEEADGRLRQAYIVRPRRFPAKPSSRAEPSGTSDTTLTAEELDFLVPGESVVIEVSGNAGTRHETGTVIRREGSLIVVSRRSARGGPYVQRFNSSDGVRIGGGERARLVDAAVGKCLEGVVDAAHRWTGRRMPPPVAGR
jgi:hypothetical protein